MMSEVTRLQSEVKRWWENNPMTYDWKGNSPYQVGSQEFFWEVDRRFWKAAWFGHEATNEPFSRLISYVRLEGKSVLEIGCGAGSLTERLARHSKYVTAIDLTKSAVDLTRRRFALHGLHGNILQMNGENLGFPDEAFDFVWSWGVIHHSSNTEQVPSRDAASSPSMLGKAEIIVIDDGSTGWNGGDGLGRFSPHHPAPI